MDDIRMEATITTIGDIFKQKIKDSIKVPTIWLDSITGEEHKDFEHTHIESRSPKTQSWWCGAKGPSYVEPADKDNGDADILIVNGPIKQVGSHVTHCRNLHGDRDQIFPFLDSLDLIFRYAKNLRTAHSSFRRINTGDGDLVLPENLLWGCPNLEEADHLFRGTKLKNIPSRLFEKCPNLESVNCLFYNTEVEEIPEDLFKNNPNITDFCSAFAMTNVKKIPNGLLAPFKEGIDCHLIEVFNFVGDTPIVDACCGDHVSSWDEITEQPTRNLYLPSYLDRWTQWGMLGQYNGVGFDDF